LWRKRSAVWVRGKEAGQPFIRTTKVAEAIRGKVGKAREDGGAFRPNGGILKELEGDKRP